MKNILIHGLGQNSKDWDTIKNELETRGITPIVPDLFDLAKGRKLDYPTVYQAFSELCESYKDKLNLCGLSLGGLLALNYAMQYPRKINSLVLIGTPFEIPKGLLKFGREKRLVTTVEFYPPEGMDSADVSYWYNGKIKRKDIIAILIELANDGYVAIHEGGGKKSDYSIERVKEYPPELDDNKRIFFDGLFETGKSVVTSKDLENRFYHTLNCIASRYRASSDATRINTLLSDRLQLVCWVVSILCLVASYMILNSTLGGAERFIAFAVGIALNLISVIVSRYVPRRTDKSHANLEKITSFRNFLNTAEKSRLEQLVLENPKYFYNILPYAYVLGVSDKWVSKFEGIAIEPPDWYVGTSAGAVTAVAVWGSMSRTLNNAASSMTSAPAQSSSSSSSGGGGVSGGGSGGGGGGSW